MYVDAAPAPGDTSSLRRLTPAGASPAWSEWPTGTGSLKHCEFAAQTGGRMASSTGRAYVFGRGKSGKARFCTFTRYGSYKIPPSALHEFGPAGKISAGVAVAVSGKGDPYYAWNTDQSAGGVGVARVRPADGKILWQNELIKTLPVRLAAVRATNNGDAVFAGRIKQSGAWRGYAGRLAAGNGGLAWHYSYTGGSGVERHLNDIVEVDGGGFLAVGAKVSGGLTGWVLRLDSGGKTKWVHLPGQPDNLDYRRVASRVPGRCTLVAEVLATGGRRHVQLREIGIDGTVAWTREFGQGSHITVHGLRWLEKGWFVLGKSGVGNVRSAWLARTNTWGHSDCAVVGGCHDKDEDDCDDGNPCTADVCNAKNGACLHVALGGMSCGLARKCVAGVCVAK